MVASNDTVAQVIAVVRRHIDNETWLRILAELEEVPGNKSFRDTIKRMRKIT